MVYNRKRPYSKAAKEISLGQHRPYGLFKGATVTYPQPLRHLSQTSPSPLRERSERGDGEVTERSERGQTSPREVTERSLKRP